MGEDEGEMIWENGIETCKLSHVKRIASPGSMIQDARGWCTGMTQRDGMGREVEGASGWGTHVHPWWIQVNVCQNQYNIVKQKNFLKKFQQLLLLHYMKQFSLRPLS